MNEAVYHEKLRKLQDLQGKFIEALEKLQEGIGTVALAKSTLNKAETELRNQQERVDQLQSLITKLTNELKNTKEL